MIKGKKDCNMEGKCDPKSRQIQMFGEKTSIPVRILKAELDSSSSHAEYRDLASVLYSLTLTVQQEETKQPISSKLRIPLSSDATVTSFAFEKLDESGVLTWFPAVPVSKKKAKEVVYREKEKGRDVAAVSNVASTKVFEIEVFPLLYKRAVRCKFEFVCPKTMKSSVSNEDLLQKLGFAFADDTELIFPKYLVHSEATVPTAPAVSVPSVYLGTAFGERHFACKVKYSDVKAAFQKTHTECAKPSPTPITNEEKQKTVTSVGIVWDTSGSQAEADIGGRCEKLQHMATQIRGLSVFRLFTFDFNGVEKIGDYDDVNELIAKVKTFHYDGGSDMTSLPPFLERQDSLAAVLIFTDGVDSFNQMPTFTRAKESPRDNTTLPPPVYCVADGGGNVNLRVLRKLVTANPRHVGRIFKEKAEHYDVDAILENCVDQFNLNRITAVGQSDDGFFGDIDDGFSCIPDHRLIGESAFQHYHLHAQDNSFVLVGRVGTDVNITGLCLQFKVGGDMECELEIPFVGASVADLDLQKEGEADAHAKTEGESSECVRRLLGLMYAIESFKCTERSAEKMDLSKDEMDILLADLAMKYNFCTPEASLLLLYTPEQFEDNDVLCPGSHPAWKQWATRVSAAAKTQELEEKKKKRREEMRRKAGIVSSEVRSADSPDNSDETSQHKTDIGDRKTLQDIIDLQKHVDTLRRGHHPPKHVDTLRRGHHPPTRHSLMERAETESDMFDCARASGSEGPAPRSAAPAPPDTKGEEKYSVPPGGKSGPVGKGSTGKGGPQAGKGGAHMDRLIAQSSMENTRAVADSNPDRTVVTSAERTVVTEPPPPINPSSYETALRGLLTSESPGKFDIFLSEYRQFRAHGGLAKSPSFFLNLGRLILEYCGVEQKDNDFYKLALKVVSNCLEMNLGDAQMLRCVGYFLLSSADYERAILVFDEVRELAPLEPQSFLDGALSRAMAVVMGMQKPGCIAHRFHTDRIEEAQNSIIHVLLHLWVERFEEIEYPALILLNWLERFIVALNLKINNSETATTLPSVWDRIGAVNALHKQDEEPTKQDRALQLLIKDRATADELLRLRYENFELGLTIWMSWDTDWTDIDLHVYEKLSNGKGEHVNYANRTSSSGGYLSRDFRGGYGPEVYSLKYPCQGSYVINVNYYGSHQASALTGATSAVLWVLHDKNVPRSKDVSPDEKKRRASRTGSEAADQEAQTNLKAQRRKSRDEPDLEKLSIEFKTVRLKSKKKRHHVHTIYINECARDETTESFFCSDIFQ